MELPNPSGGDFGTCRFPARLIIFLHLWYVTVVISLLWWFRKHEAWDGVFILLLGVIGFSQLCLLDDE